MNAVMIPRITRHHAVVIFTALLTLWSAVACKCLVSSATDFVASASSSPSLHGEPSGSTANRQSAAHACCTTKPTHDQSAPSPHADQNDCTHCLTASASLAPTVSTPVASDIAVSHLVAFVASPVMVDASTIAPFHRIDGRDSPPPRDALTLRAQHTLLTV